MALEAIKEDYDNGMRLTDIAAKHGKSEAAIWKTIERAGWTRDKPCRRSRSGT